MTVEYHKDDDGNFILDEYGSKIPLEQCLCYAKDPSECCCDCTSWTDNYIEDDDYEWDNE